MEHCATVIPDNACLAVCWEEEAATEDDVHSRAGGSIQCEDGRGAGYLLSPRESTAVLNILAT